MGSRARASANAVDRDVVDRLDPDEWGAHHLIGIHPARRHIALLSAAAQAGWYMDSSGNLIALPRTRAAQAKLARAGIRLPLHDHGHPTWNEDVHQELIPIEQELARSPFTRGSDEYASAARRLLENLQTKLRNRAIRMDRIVENEAFSAENPATA